MYQLLKALYNLSPLHPLSHIPGPKLAAATYLHEFYYDVIKFGCYTKEIGTMHDRYGEWVGATISEDRSRHEAKLSSGPLVRINPNEVHCNDIAFADEIYAVGGRKRDKPIHQVNGSA